MNARPLLLLFMSGAFFFLCDNAIFRSGLYDRVIGANTPLGQIVHMRDLELVRSQSKDKKEILLLGSSKPGWAFSMKLYDNLFTNSPYRVLQGSIDNTEMKEWYYLLPAVDKHQSRYAAILVPIAGYQADGREANLLNGYDDARMDSLLLSPGDWPYFISTFPDPDMRYKVTVLGLFHSHDYALDIQDLIAHPLERQEAIRELNDAGSLWARSYDWDGKPDSIGRGLKLDPENNKIISFPEYFTFGKRMDMESEFRAMPVAQVVENTRANAVYLTRWATKIVEFYQKSATKVIFFQIPRRPLAAPMHQLLPDAPDIRDALAGKPNVYFIAPDEFVALEQPRYFYDMKHMNTEGRHIFTKLLVDQVQQIFGSS